MKTLDAETEKAAKRMLTNALIQIIGKEDELTVEKLYGIQGFFNAEARDDPAFQYFQAFGMNAAAALQDLKKRFPEVFNDYGFGDKQTVQADPGADPEQATINNKNAQPPVQQQYNGQQMQYMQQSGSGGISGGVLLAVGAAGIIYLLNL